MKKAEFLIKVTQINTYDDHEFCSKQMKLEIVKKWPLIPNIITGSMLNLKVNST